MEFTAKQIAQFVQGHVEGDENAIVNTFAKIEEGKKGAISFLSNPKYTHYVYDTQSSVVLIDECRTGKARFHNIDSRKECLRMRGKTSADV